MSPMIYPFITAECEICGTSVPEASLQTHMMADVRILRIIKANRPDWDRLECEEYLRGLYGPRLVRHSN